MRKTASSQAFHSTSGRIPPQSAYIFARRQVIFSWKTDLHALCCYTGYQARNNAPARLKAYLQYQVTQDHRSKKEDRIPMEDVQERMRQMREARRAFCKEYGADINKAIPMYEDPTRYPVQELIDLFRLQCDMRDEKDPDLKAQKKAAFIAARDKIQLLPDAPDRIYLWKEGNMPVQTEYTENPDNMYDHEPDFKPYMLEMLVDESVKPLGAIVLVAGGTHGAGSINECYEVGLEFNQKGYQCFILQCRPNGSPWNAQETGVDAARAFRIIRANEAKYRVPSDHMIYAGFSNGGVTGDSCIEFYSGDQKVVDYFPDYVPDELDELPGGPDAVMYIYAVRHLGTPYKEDGFVYPPTFISVGREDKGCMANLGGFLPWAWERNIPVEVHTYAHHPHGYAGWKIIDGKGDPNFDLWIEHADIFLKDLFAEKWPMINETSFT